MEKKAFLVTLIGKDTHPTKVFLPKRNENPQ